MKAPGIVQRHPELRWLASAAIIVAAIVIVTSALSGVFRDDSSGLHATGPEQLVSQVRTPYHGGYSGTVYSTVNLGMPATLTAALAGEMPIGGRLLSGSHSFRYWYGGAEKQRVALTEPSAEQDLFRNGDDIVFWDTATRELRQLHGVHEEPGVLPLSISAPAELAPPQLADRVLSLARSGDSTTLRNGADVVGRKTYELVVTPASANSLIDSVHIQVDGVHAIPLGVQIYARHQTRPVVDVQFTTINFNRPPDRNFSFVAPSDARMVPVADLDSVSTVGSSWTQVATYRASWASAALITDLLGSAARQVKGTWGSGRLVTAPAISLLNTTRGAVVVGAVSPAVLYRAVPR